MSKVPTVVKLASMMQTVGSNATSW